MRAPTRLVLACLLASVPASAGDLTGTWKGKWSCKAQNAEGKLKLSSTSVQEPEPGVSTLEISHPHEPADPALQARIDGVLFAGFTLVTAATVGGVGAFVGCDPGDLRSFKWKAMPNVVKGKITWRGTFVRDDATLGSCRGSWTRVSLEDPAVSDTCR